MEKETHSTWAESTMDKIVRREKKSYTCHGMWTPSGYFHIGNARPEIFTPYAVRKALETNGHKVTHRFLADDFDPIIKVPSGLPIKESDHNDYLGKPSALAKSPFEGHKSWSDYFTSDVLEALPGFGVNLTFESSYNEYKQGLFNDLIRTALEKSREIMEIWIRISKADKSLDTLPIQVLCPDSQHIVSDVSNWNGDTVNYKCKFCKSEGEIKPKDGNAKLNWRVHWAAHWAHYGVDFETAGKDHFSKGGSVDVSRVICKDIFGVEPPIQFPTEFIQLKSGSKMSGSIGNVISLKEWLETADPELYRFMIFSYRPQTVIEFGLNDNSFVLLNDQFENAERLYYGQSEAQTEKLTQKIKREYELAKIDSPSENAPNQLKFSFAILLSQLLDPKTQMSEIEEIIKSSGHTKEKLTEQDTERFAKKLNYTKYWIEHYAPEQYKIRFFGEQNETFKKLATSEMVKCIQLLAKSLKEENTAEEIQQRIYETAKENDVKPKDLFKALYALLINREQGPKIGTLIHALGFKRVIESLKKI